MSLTDSKIQVEKMPTREEMLQKLAGIINHCEHKTLRGRVKDKAIERIKQGWASDTINGIKTYLSGLRDVELDNITARLEALEAKNDNR